MWYSVMAHSISFKVAFVQCMAGRKAPLRRRILAFQWFVFCLALFMKLAFCLNSFLLDVFLQRIKTVDRPYSLVIFSSLQNVISTVAWLHLYSLLWTMWLKNWKKCFDGSVQSSLASVPHCLSSWHCFLQYRCATTSDGRDAIGFLKFYLFNVYLHVHLHTRSGHQISL